MPLGNDSETKAATPPYTAFASIKTTISNFKEHGVPSRIDRTVLTNFSGAVRGQVLTAIKFLGLIQGDNRPTEQLIALVDVYGTEAWGPKLLHVLQRSYAPLFGIELENATSGQFNEKFRAEYPGTDDVQRKSIAFFLNAIRETPFPISKYIMANKKPRSAGSKRKGARKENRTRQDNENENNRYTPPPIVERKLSEQVLAVLDDNPEREVQDAVFVLLKYLRKEGK
jgi:hypothetical protein